MITSIDQLDLSKTYTYADYLAWAFEDRLELIRGYVAKMSPAPTWTHQRILMRLIRPLSFHFAEHSCELLCAPFDVRLILPSDLQLTSGKIRTKRVSDTEVSTVVQPDLCIICDMEKMDERGCFGAPDLVVEILSPGNTNREMNDKFSVYEEAGVREYWLVHPADRNVLVYVLNGEGQFVARRPFTDEDILRSTIFPDVEIELAPIFG